MFRCDGLGRIVAVVAKKLVLVSRITRNPAVTICINGLEAVRFLYYKFIGGQEGTSRMRNRFQCVLSLFFCVLLTICGCSSGSAPKPDTPAPTPTPTPTPAVSVSVSPQAVATGTGQTVPFVATVKNGTSGVAWAASAGTIDANGIFVAPPGPQSATVTITATSKDDATKSASSTVNVVAPGQVTPTANPQVASYAISPAAAGGVSCSSDSIPTTV